MSRIIIYYYRGLIERGNGKPGYDWHNGYSDGISYPWQTRRECQQEAKAMGCIASFSPDDRRY